MKTMHQLVLIRHGETVWNKENKFTGWTDVELTEKGISEVHEAGKILRKEGYSFDSGFTSVLRRAKETLRIILEEMELDIPFKEDWHLNERHYGALQGLNKAEMSAKYGEEKVKKWRRGYATPPPPLDISDKRHPSHDPLYKDIDRKLLPSSESLKDTVTRVVPYWKGDIAPAIKSGKKVIVSAPCKDCAGYVLGVNTENFDIDKDDVIDMGSCTTNCLAPVAKVLHDNFGIVKGFMTTVHSYTNDQKILDLPHKDLRRARAAAINIIPTSTGAAKAIGKMIPELDGRLDGIAMRVPTPVVSVLDLIVEVEKPTSKEEINEAFKKAAASENLKGRLRVEEGELVSMDFKGDSYSSIVDAGLTMANGSMVKVVAWYDNEFAFSCRLAEFAEFISKKL